MDQIKFASHARRSNDGRHAVICIASRQPAIARVCGPNQYRTTQDASRVPVVVVVGGPRELFCLVSIGDVPVDESHRTPVQ